MKKILISALAAALALTSVSAQEQVMKPSSFWDNWFVQLQGGGSLTISEDFKKASFGDLISPHAAISVGKYFAPQFGARLQANGWQSRNYVNATDSKYKFNYIQANADALVNLTNIFLPYKEDRVFNLIAIGGIGYVHGFKKDGVIGVTNSVVPRAGLQADFRVNNRINVNLEAIGNLMYDGFNGRHYGAKNDATVNLLAGITFKLGKSGFDMVSYADPSQIDELNRQINAQRSSLNDKDRQISDLQSALAKKPTVVTEEVKKTIEETEMNAVVVFKLGKSDLQDNQEINIFNAAKYFQENPDLNIIVTGYADKATGTAAINQALSERRAEAVAKILVEKYGINPKRITKQASGDREQPFQNDAWNRVVIFTAVPAK